MPPGAVGVRIAMGMRMVNGRKCVRVVDQLQYFVRTPFLTQLSSVIIQDEPRFNYLSILK